MVRSIVVSDSSWDHSNILYVNSDIDTGSSAEAEADRALHQLKLGDGAFV